MSRILVTGSSDGLGRAAAKPLLDDGHEVVVHVRSPERLVAVRDLLYRGAQSVVGDLTRLEVVLDVARQANMLGRFDAVLHNAGVIGGPSLLPVNVVAPFVLTAVRQQALRRCARCRRCKAVARGGCAGGGPRLGSHSDGRTKCQR